MPINKTLIRQAIDSLSQVKGLYIHPTSLVEDVILLSYAFDDEEDFMAACASTRRAFEQLILGNVDTSNLKYEFEDWQSFHYQPRVGQGIKANCRVLFRRIDGGIEVKGFGHRCITADFYQRMSSARSNKA